MRIHLLMTCAVVALVGCGPGNPGDGTSSPAEAGATAVVRLPPAQANAPPTAVVVPAASAQVQFRLAGLDRPSAELTAELERVGGDQIRRWPVVDAPAAPDGATHAVVVPIYEAQPGEYVLTVWASDVEVVRRYRYRVGAPAP